jgi:hypothetical protein
LELHDSGVFILVRVGSKENSTLGVYNQFDFVKSPEYICGEIFVENLSLGNDVVKVHDKLIERSPE